MNEKYHVSKSDIVQLMTNYSIEVTPKSAVKVGDFRRLLKKGTEVYVTHLSGSDFADTLRTCTQLQAQEMTAVPHVALRNFRDETELRYAFDAIEKAKINGILLIAGALSQPKGPYDSVVSLLKTGLLETYHFDAVGFAGHPEGSPVISAKEQEDAEAQKQGYALTYPRHYYFMTQFCFAAQPVIDWTAGLSSRAIDLPVRVGIPGVASIHSLIKHATACGIGASMDFLRKNSRNIKQLMRPGKPDKLLYDLAAFCRESTGHQRIEKLHFYPLGSFEQTVHWIKQVESGQFTLTEHGFYTDD